MPYWVYLVVIHANKLNFLTTSEHVEIIASLKYSHEKAYGCHSEEAYKMDGKWVTQERIDKIRKVKGCDKLIEDKKYYHRYAEMRFKRCVCNYYNYQIHWLLEVNEYYVKNLSVHPRYIYKDQGVSSKLSHSLKIVNNYLLQREVEKIQKQNEEVNKKLRKNKGVNG